MPRNGNNWVRLGAVAVMLMTSVPATAQDVHADIVARLARIESLLLQGSGGGGGGAVRSIVNFTCLPGANCNSAAKEHCAQAGFSAGVVSRGEYGTYYFKATEVTCVR